MLNERKKKILQAIVEEYVDTAEPVSSNALVGKYDLQCSSATIRNEMMELEKIGLLDKPHTSAGRVPSAKGYRFYVDELVQENYLSMEEIEYIKSKLEVRANEIEEFTKIITNTLAEVTHYTSLAVSPSNSTQNISEIKFILLGSKLLMVVILTDGGLIKETIIKFDEDVTESQIKTVDEIFNKKLKGVPLAEITQPMEEYILAEMQNELNIIKPIIEQINKVIKEHKKVYLEGANKVFDFPEFNEVSAAKNFLNVIDKKGFVESILEDELAKDINVYIGSEGDDESLKDFSIVTFKHKVNGKDLGTIGIIGPTRMDYSRVISIMKYISEQLKGKEE
ncbi:MAG: heat-inducible transcriptional repressor HrcA [Oscillospiraceae bacterium]|nr:heat-inducible transcriptional repressor HrcA [Oscillospiraceae bacterium]